MTTYEAREQARTETMVERTELVRLLLRRAETANSHWLAYDLVDAARVVWGSSHCPEFRKMAGAALEHARSIEKMLPKWRAPGPLGACR